MRHLIACAECHRQYDAHRVGVGKQVRCRCGSVITVTQPRGHEARVVRCSSCGAPRTEGSPSCGHCLSDFTLHERDLQTVCPRCFARVSDRARYCHSCAALLSPEEEIGVYTDLHCPACVRKTSLLSRRFGDENVSALECDACAGLWLSLEVFEHLTRRAKEADVPSLTRGRRPARQSERRPTRSGYRPCPHCRTLMVRRNYGNTRGQRSGVIIDFCKDHGVWFDSDELNRILAWLKQGGDPERPDLSRDPPPGGYVSPYAEPEVDFDCPPVETDVLRSIMRAFFGRWR